jgi:uncharacterized protein
MKLPGVVTNITAFGAFVDIGVHQDGLVHVSELADGFVKSPGDVVKVNQKVDVTVLAVDLPRKRISLSMKKFPGQKPERPPRPAAGEHRDRPAAPPKGNEAKRGKKAPAPFNNPFAEAFRRK